MSLGEDDSYYNEQKYNYDTERYEWDCTDGYD